MSELLIRNAEVAGRPGLDVRIRDGVIAEIGPRLAGRDDEIDARGGALIPGLVDHHIHLLATAAHAGSLDVSAARSAEDFVERLTIFAASRPRGSWLRVLGYHERMAGLLDRLDLDRLVPDHPLRLQHQTGSLWMLNGRALDAVGQDGAPAGLERDAAGRPTGRLWRGDAWLAERIGRTSPDLASLGAGLAAFGVTGLMDASASTDAAAARVLADAHRAGALPQRLALMSFGALASPDDAAFAVGPRKILLDDHDLPDLDAFVGWIAEARAWLRPVAVHCVTAGELALTLAAFQAAGARPGDRIEHGGVIAADAIAVIAGLGLCVVTQPSFVFERGDRYRADVPPEEHDDLYRCASLLAAGIPVALSSDAPYAAPDPWATIRAAASRRTRDGATLGLGERIDAETALALHGGGLFAPGRPTRSLAVGAPADLCLLHAPIADVLGAPAPDLVAATIIEGRLAFQKR